jgi:tetratricopeptide (TPR) repeat protein
MQMTKTQKIIVSVVAVVVLLSVYIAFDRRSKSNTNNNTETEATSTTSASHETLNPNGTNDYTVEQVPVQTQVKAKVPVPDLNRPIYFLPSLKLNQDIQDLVTSKINSLRAVLKNDPTQLTYWIDLGMYQKMGGDYEGAAISWKYVAAVTSKDFIAYGNLGDLYAYYIKNNGMSETYYKLAIARDSKQAYLYIQLAAVYKDVFHDLDKARAILDQGLKALPNDPALLEAKNNL